MWHTKSKMFPIWPFTEEKLATSLVFSLVTVPNLFAFISED